MAIHKSLKSKDTLKRQRNVMNRWERVEALREREAWEEGSSVYGLPKVRVYRARKRTKVKKEAVEAATAVETAEGPETPGSTAPEGASSDRKT